jgi:hypothetical protein
MRGRPILGAISGLIFGLGLALLLLGLGVLPFESIAVTVLPPAGLVLGLVLGLWAPVRREA